MVTNIGGLSGCLLQKSKVAIESIKLESTVPKSVGHRKSGEF